MSPLFYAVVGIGVIVAIVLIWLLVDFAMRKLSAWRDARDLRVRNSELRRYTGDAFKGTKQRQL